MLMKILFYVNHTVSFSFMYLVTKNVYNLSVSEWIPKCVTCFVKVLY